MYYEMDNLPDAEKYMKMALDNQEKDRIIRIHFYPKVGTTVLWELN